MKYEIPSNQAQSLSKSGAGAVTAGTKFVLYDPDYPGGIYCTIQDIADYFYANLDTDNAIVRWDNNGSALDDNTQSFIDDNGNILVVGSATSDKSAISYGGDLNGHKTFIQTHRDHSNGGTGYGHDIIISQFGNSTLHPSIAFTKSGGTKASPATITDNTPTLQIKSFRYSSGNGYLAVSNYYHYANASYSHAHTWQTTNNLAWTCSMSLFSVNSGSAALIVGYDGGLSSNILPSGGVYTYGDVYGGGASFGAMQYNGTASAFSGFRLDPVTTNVSPGVTTGGLKLYEVHSGSNWNSSNYTAALIAEFYSAKIQIGGGASVTPLRFMEASGNGTNYVGFQAPASIATSVDWILPNADAASANYALLSDGAGNLSWGVPSIAGADHGSLTGLTDDDHTQYALLAGRSGGQTLRGGTGASEGLTVYANTTSTSGAIRFYARETSSLEMLHLNTGGNQMYGNLTVQNHVGTANTCAIQCNGWGATITANVVAGSDDAKFTARISSVIYSWGVDNSETGDPCVFSCSSSLGTNNVFTISNSTQILDFTNTPTVGGTDLALITDVVTDHGALSGLGDDDHTQYSLISSQAGAPSSTPSRVGLINIDTSGAAAYISTGTASSADWEQIDTTGGVSDHGGLTGLADDDHTQYWTVAGRAGESLSIWDAGGTDKCVFSRDGTDFSATFTNTTDWNISGFDGSVKITAPAAGYAMKVLGRSSDNVGLIGFMDNTDATLYGYVGGTASEIYVYHNGSGQVSVWPNFSVWDSGRTDKMQFQHDGTDFNLTGTNTTEIDINISGSDDFHFGLNTTESIPVFSGGTTQKALILMNGRVAATSYQLAVSGGSALRLYDNGVNDEAAIDIHKSGNWHGTYFKWVASNAHPTYRILNTGGTDYVDFYHDGTDFNLACTNTTDINITGTTWLDTDGGLKCSGTGTKNHAFTNNAGTFTSGSAGNDHFKYTGDDYFYFDNYDNGVFQFRGPSYVSHTFLDNYKWGFGTTAPATYKTTGAVVTASGTAANSGSIGLKLEGNGSAGGYGYVLTEVFQINSISSATEISRITGSGSNGMGMVVEITVTGHTSTVGNGSAKKIYHYPGGTTAPTLMATVATYGSQPTISFDTSSSNVLIVKLASNDGSNPFSGVMEIKYYVPQDFSSNTWTVS